MHEFLLKKSLMSASSQDDKKYAHIHSRNYLIKHLFYKRRAVDLLQSHLKLRQLTEIMLLRVQGKWYCGVIARIPRLCIDDELRGHAEDAVSEATAVDVAQRWVVVLTVQREPGSMCVYVGVGDLVFPNVDSMYAQVWNGMHIEIAVQAHACVCGLKHAIEWVFMSIHVYSHRSSVYVCMQAKTKRSTAARVVLEM